MVLGGIVDHWLVGTGALAIDGLEVLGRSLLTRGRSTRSRCGRRPSRSHVRQAGAARWSGTSADGPAPRAGSTPHRTSGPRSRPRRWQSRRCSADCSTLRWCTNRLLWGATHSPPTSWRGVHRLLSGIPIPSSQALMHRPPALQLAPAMTALQKSSSFMSAVHVPPCQVQLGRSLHGPCSSAVQAQTTPLSSEQLYSGVWGFPVQNSSTSGVVSMQRLGQEPQS